jgi:hypothetical protein
LADTKDSLWQMAEDYANVPVMRAIIKTTISVLATVLPAAGELDALDEALLAHVARMRQNRTRIFYDELAHGAHKLTEELIQTDDFLHAYFSVLRASINTKREEKIRLFARLLLGAVTANQLGDDRFEEFVEILDDLSVRELEILYIVKRFEDAYPLQEVALSRNPSEPETELQFISRFWPELEATLEDEVNILPEELPAILTRLQRTGLYQTFAGLYLDYRPGEGKVTALFTEFAHWLQEQPR